MAQENKDNAGFNLPDPAAPAAVDAPATAATQDSGAATTTGTIEQQPADAQLAVDTGSRDLLIGGAILLVLFVVFFLAKNAYANSLVAKKLPPSKANASALWLFIFLFSISVGVVLSAVNAARFMGPVLLVPVAVVALASLLLMFSAGRR